MLILNQTSDLSWLPSIELLGLDLPTIVWETDIGQHYGGYYETGTNRIIIVEGDEDLLPGTIAHEFKHYQQFMTGKVIHSIEFKSDIEYEKSINEFFNKSWSEMDALIFQQKHASDWCSEWWLKKLIVEYPI